MEQQVQKYIDTGCLKKALHITNHKGTTKNINNVIRMLNMDMSMNKDMDTDMDKDMNKDMDKSSSTNKGTELKNIQLNTLSCDFPFFISSINASEIWEKYKDIVYEYDYLIFTDTSMYARPFLEFINSHKAKVIIYITNRFDWGMWGFVDKTFYELYSSMSYNNSENNRRVVFCSDNKYDQYYASLYNVHFFFNTNIRLVPNLCDQLYMPLDKNIIDACLFIYNRGTKIDKYEVLLEQYSISYDVFGPSPDKSYKDETHICEYIGFLHLPYQANIQSLWENLGAYIIYFIPSKTFIKELLKTDWYYWEEKNGKPYYHAELIEKSIDLSEWYCEENACLFEYFDSWNHLKLLLVEKYKGIDNIVNIRNKKQIIRDYMIKSNKDNIRKWIELFK
jgi:hypothetical protein